MEDEHITSESRTVLVIGGGIFGVSASLELRRRGYEVTLLDRGTLPHPQASSTDITKMIRGDYGPDTFYTDLMDESFIGWDMWNKIFPRALYHETGFLLLMREAMRPGSFEMESLQVMQKKQYPVVRIDRRWLQAHAPAWNPDMYPDGYYNVRGGWAESGHVVAQLVATARHEGVRILEQAHPKKLVEKSGRVTGIVAADGAVFRASLTIVAAGAWTTELVPELSDCLRPTAQPVFHLLPKNPFAFRGEVFPGWSADISKTGWYGFPAQPDGVVKIANHGSGIAHTTDTAAAIPERYHTALRQFLSESIPSLKDAPVVKSRICLYCDSWDGDFYIDHHPTRPGLMVATGGSGHGFKFAPVLGSIIADVAEHLPNRFAHRFRWREPGDHKYEAARAVT